LEEIDVKETGRAETPTQCNWIFTVLGYTVVLFFVLLIKNNCYNACDFPPSHFQLGHRTQVPMFLNITLPYQAANQKPVDYNQCHAYGLAQRRNCCCWTAHNPSMAFYSTLVEAAGVGRCMVQQSCSSALYQRPNS